jgi:uncharacterized membrane protein YuzA (DUF378 family)
MKLHTITFILLIIGGLAWGLEAFSWNPISRLGDTIPMIIYILVGLSAIYEIVAHKSICKNCATNGQM